MAFDYFKFDDLLEKIEARLGYLKGNELAWQYLVDARDQLGGMTPPGDDYLPTQWWLEDCVFPVPGHEVDPTRWFQFTFWTPRDLIADHDNPSELGAAHAKYMKDVAEGAKLAWENGASWASGLASYCREICDSFTRPDADNIVRNIETLHTRVTSKFSLNVLDDWAGLGGVESDWDSRGGRNFQTFYDNYDGQIAQMAFFCVEVARGFAAAAQVIHGTQVGAIAFAESMVQILDQQLEAWAPIGPPPQEAPETPPWVTDVTKIVKEGWDVLGHVPVVKDVKSQVDAVITAGRDITEFAQAIADATGADLPTISRTLATGDSDAAYDLLTTTLYEDYHQKFKTAMDSLQSGSSIDPSSPTYQPPVNTGETRGQVPPIGWFPEANMPTRESMR